MKWMAMILVSMSFVSAAMADEGDLTVSTPAERPDALLLNEFLGDDDQAWALQTGFLVLSAPAEISETGVEPRRPRLSRPTEMPPQSLKR